jgi:uroporphyrinogen-III decarboxylase
MEFFEYMQDRCPKMEFEGLPVLPPDGIPGESTDGPFTVACKLRGLTEACLDIYEDPKYLHDLTGFVTDNTVRRIRAIKEWRWDRKPDSKDRGQYRTANWAFADDAIAMLSPGQYREFVFPYHRKLVDAFSDGGHVSIHLCGDATHHFRFLKENLKVYSFDTGFPVDFGKLRRELGPDVQIYGGPSVTILKYASADAVRQEVKRICGSGIMEGGRFVLREANNLAPGTPIENVEAMYDAANEFGRYV